MHAAAAAAMLRLVWPLLQHTCRHRLPVDRPDRELKGKARRRTVLRLSHRRAVRLQLPHSGPRCPYVHPHARAPRGQGGRRGAPHGGVPQRQKECRRPVQLRCCGCLAAYSEVGPWQGRLPVGGFRGWLLVASRGQRAESLQG